MLLELPTPDDPLIRESNKEEEEDTETLTRFLRTCQWVYSSNSPPAKHVKVHSRSMKLASSYTLIPRGFFDKGVHQDEFSYEQAVYSQFYFHTDTLIIENDVESENIQFLCRYIEETELQCKTVELWNVRIDVHDDDFNRLFRLLSAQTLVFNYNGDYPRNNKGLTFSQIGEVYITCESIEEEHIGQLKSPDLTIGCKFISENSVIAIIQQWYGGEREIEKLCLTQQAHHIDIKTIRKRLELMQIHLSPMDKNAYNAPATAISMYHVGAPEKDEDLLIIVAEKNVTIAKLRVSPAEFMRKYEGIEKLLGCFRTVSFLNVLQAGELKLDSSPMSLDDTLRNLNGTLDRIADLLHTVEIAILIVAIALSILMIGSVAVCYYDKYKKYNTVRTDEDDRPSYTKSSYHHTDI